MKALRAYSDVQKSKDSRKIRAGKGKMRNRRYIQKKGPLIIYNEDHGLTRAFRNMPGVELRHVDQLNLPPAGPRRTSWSLLHLDQVCLLQTGRPLRHLEKEIHREEKLQVRIYNSILRKQFYGVDFFFSLPRPKMIQTDLSRLINSDEIQKVVRPMR